eukprot:SAG11_NODE_1285_length_5300_cov_1.629494_7_plen_101_part_00
MQPQDCLAEPQYGALHTWFPSIVRRHIRTDVAAHACLVYWLEALIKCFAPFWSCKVRHISKCARDANRVYRLFEEQQDKWYFRPAALSREGARVDRSLQV